MSYKHQRDEATKEMIHPCLIYLVHVISPVQHVPCVEHSVQRVEGLVRKGLGYTGTVILLTPPLLCC